MRIIKLPLLNAGFNVTLFWACVRKISKLGTQQKARLLLALALVLLNKKRITKSLFGQILHKARGGRRNETTYTLWFFFSKNRMQNGLLHLVSYKLGHCGICNRKGLAPTVIDYSLLNLPSRRRNNFLGTISFLRFMSLFLTLSRERGNWKVKKVDVRFYLIAIFIVGWRVSVPYLVRQPKSLKLVETNLSYKLLKVGFDWRLKTIITLYLTEKNVDNFKFIQKVDYTSFDGSNFII